MKFQNIKKQFSWLVYYSYATDEEKKMLDKLPDKLIDTPSEDLLKIARGLPEPRRSMALALLYLPQEDKITHIWNRVVGDYHVQSLIERWALDGVIELNESPKRKRKWSK